MHQVQDETSGKHRVIGHNTSSREGQVAGGGGERTAMQGRERKERCIEEREKAKRSQCKALPATVSGHRRTRIDLSFCFSSF
jgi:hypothetical protein